MKTFIKLFIGISFMIFGFYLPFLMINENQIEATVTPLPEEMTFHKEWVE